MKKRSLVNPIDHRDVINWQACTPQELYLLQYYGKTAEIRKHAKSELLKRECVKA